MGNPEQDARGGIDQLLVHVGWHVCDTDQANITACRGVAIREFPLPGHGFADYLLYISYIAWFLRSQDAQNYFKRVARGVAVKGVNIADVKICPVPLPSLREQQRIATEIDHRLSFIRERLRQSILATAFAGRVSTSAVAVEQSLTVEQVPAYSIRSGRD